MWKGSSRGSDEQFSTTDSSHLQQEITVCQLHVRQSGVNQAQVIIEITVTCSVAVTKETTVTRPGSQVSDRQGD